MHSITTLFGIQLVSPAYRDNSFVIFGLEKKTLVNGADMLKFSLAIDSSPTRIILCGMRIIGGVVKPPQAKAFKRTFDQAYFGKETRHELYKLLSQIAELYEIKLKEENKAVGNLACLLYTSDAADE